MIKSEGKIKNLQYACPFGLSEGCNAFNTNGQVAIYDVCKVGRADNPSASMRKLSKDPDLRASIII
jgi:hypothetical protein